MNEYNDLLFRRKGNTSLPVLEVRNAGNTELPVLTFPEINKTGVAELIFTTRLGGVSGKKPGKEHLSSLNLSFTRGDDPENVRENFRRVASALGTSSDRFVFTDQTHTSNVRVVTEADAGCGITKERTYHDIDALVTNVPELVLSVFVADCVPVAIVDPVHRAIGLAHSGWRGTVAKITEKTIRTMTDQYGTRPEDLICAIGPSICRDCYEISTDVAEEFMNAFSGHEDEILEDKHNGHFQLDLWKANELVLRGAGVLPDRIQVTGICTCCNRDILYSHRGSHGMRGNLGAFLKLRG
ncbi:MAG: peptidoglycan editing factor PgeF [Eubacteriales bacterium]|jgi:YfiH family protein